jgi:predicted  nucleic acid-binding Zn-ribbon protein
MGDLKDALEALGACDEELTSLRREEKEIPRTIGELEARIQATSDSISSEQQRIEDAERRRRDLENELQDCEARRDKFQSQSALVKTNTEYTALLHEIELTTRRIGEIEEEILVSLEQGETIEGEVAQAVERQSAALRGLEQRLAESRVRLGEVERELVMQEEERSRVLDEVGPHIRSHYARVCKVRANGVARIRGRSCGGCNRDVPLEIVNRVRAGEFHACGACQRILLGESE